MKLGEYLRYFWVVVVLVLSSACSGGGGESESNVPQLTVSSDNIEFATSVLNRIGTIPTEKTFTGTVSNLGNNNIYVQLQYSNSGVDYVDYNFISADSAKVYVYPKDPFDLTVGTYTDEITILVCTDPNCNQQVSGSPKKIAVKYIVNNRLSVDQKSLSFNQTIGNPISAPQIINVGGDGTSWSVHSNQSWISVYPSSDLAPSSLSIDTDSTGLALGVYSGTVTVTNIHTQEIIDVAVTLHVDVNRLLISDNGVAFSSTPGASILSKSVTVKNAYGKSSNTPWSAISNQSWLDVTSNGMTGDSLTLTADPAGLIKDTIYYANVTVSSSETLVENQETIRVGFWVGSSVPNVMDTKSLIPVDAINIDLATDPIRPYVYVSNGGGDVIIYNVYTANLVDVITGIGTKVGALAINSRGDTLYALDVDANNIIPINLDTMSTGAAISLGVFYVTELDYIRPQGYGLIVLSNGIFLSEQTNLIVNNANYSDGISSNYITASSLDGSRFCSLNKGLSPFTLSCSNLTYSYYNESLDITSTISIFGAGYGGFGTDIAVSDDGNKVVVASDSTIAFNEFDTSTLFFTRNFLEVNKTPNNIEMTFDGKMVRGYFSFYDTEYTDDIYVYGSDSSVMGAFRFAQYSDYSTALKDRQLKISSDGMRLIGLTYNSLLRIVDMP